MVEASNKNTFYKIILLLPIHPSIAQKER